MVMLKKVTKARTSRELEKYVSDDVERGWKIASQMRHFPQDSRPYQILMKFETDKERVS